MNAAAPVAMLLTDLVDSTLHAEALGDAAWAAVSARHDRAARELLRGWRGREIDKTDGFLLIFDSAADALGFALAYHRMLGTIDPRLVARAGLHVGQVVLRTNPPGEVERGAKPVEVDGSNKALAARVMALALGGQTLLTAAAREVLGDVAQPIVSHGHWRLKGLAEPVELFEAGDLGAPPMPPPDGPKAYRVVQQGGLWLPLGATRHSLPAQRDAFVGRNDALRDLAQRFERGARLVSVLGTGGSGKTRLATRFGWAWLGDYPGGVWFCDLAPARSLEGVLQAVARGLEVPLGDADPGTQLGHAIAGRGDCLVILDNFEQVARHAEDTLGRWLERAAQARFLVTTREVLGIRGEEAFALAPMPQAEATELFLRRAASSRHGFAPDAADRDAVVELARLLDGLPLAIELAAARTRLLSPRALLARMSERFRVLALSGRRQDRQVTLRTTFDWSWELLNAAERSALAQLSVFEGSFTLEAVEAVIDVSDCGAAPWSGDLLQSLVDKSFVRALDHDRFTLLVSIQAYAAEHLVAEGHFPGSGPAAQQAAQGRHGSWFAALGPTRARGDACADLDNLVVACRRAMAQGQVAVAVGALEGAWAALSLHGPFGDGTALAESVCAMAALDGDFAARAHAVCGNAWSTVGRPSEARAQFETALALAREHHDRRCEAQVRIALSTLYAQDGKVEQAMAGHAEALTLAREIGDAGIEFLALGDLGNAESDQGRLDSALEHYEAGMERARELNDLNGQCAMLGNLGVLHASVGRMALALACFEDALELARRLGDRQREVNTLSNLGMLHQVQGRSDDAITILQQALQVARQLGHVRIESTLLCNLGLALEDGGRFGEALASFEAALQAARLLGDRGSEGQVLGYLGRAHVRRRAHAQARECFAAGQSLLRELSDPISLAVLLCGSAECERTDGDLAAARSALQEAQAIADNAGAGPQSELGLAIARLQGLAAPSGAERLPSPSDS